MRSETRQAELDNAALWRQWFNAAAHADMQRAIASLYATLDQQIAAHSPTCWQSGKCCHFDAYGHRLYVTGLEIAIFLQHVEAERDKPRDQAQTHKPSPRQDALPVLDSIGPACPFQHDRQSTVHTIRPLGCRVFFCQQGTQGWQQQLYEAYLQELRALHDAQGLAYRYMEWRAGLAEARAISDRW